MHNHFLSHIYALSFCYWDSPLFGQYNIRCSQDKLIYILNSFLKNAGKCANTKWAQFNKTSANPQPRNEMQCHTVTLLNTSNSTFAKDSLAEWSKALAQGASPQGHGFPFPIAVRGRGAEGCCSRQAGIMWNENPQLQFSYGSSALCAEKIGFQFTACRMFAWPKATQKNGQKKTREATFR